VIEHVPTRPSIHTPILPPSLKKKKGWKKKKPWEPEGNGKDLIDTVNSEFLIQ
jgi:hypothetical protein